MPWIPFEELSQADKDQRARDIERINKAWGEQNETARRKRVAENLGFEKDEEETSVQRPKEGPSQRSKQCSIM